MKITGTQMACMQGPLSFSLSGFNLSVRVSAFSLAMVALLAACGGDGGDSRNFNQLGGTIALQLVNAPPDAVTGLVLNDGTETYAPTLQTAGKNNSEIAFTFPTAMSQGTNYAVSVISSPQGMGCVAGNAKGTMGAAPISTVTVTCTDSVFYVSGNVQLNFANPLPSNVELAISDGTDSISVQLPEGATTGTVTPSFLFPTPLKAGSSYRVTVPSNPTDLTCTPANASGTIAATNVTNVSVTCSDSAFYLSGQATVSLQQPYTSNTATVLLTDGTDLAYPVNISIGGGALTGSQSFIFPSLVAQGAAYTVSVTTNPSGNPIGLTCTPSSNQGTVANANITNIAVSCSDQVYPIAVTATGLQIAGSVQLTDNVESTLVTPASLSSGLATFPTQFAYDASYLVQITAQSLVQCTLANAAGTVLGPVSSIALTCSLPELAALAGQVVPYPPAYPNSGTNPLQASLGLLGGLAVDSAGTIYFSDFEHSSIRKISTLGVVSTVAGGTFGSANGTGAGVGFDYPSGVAVDGAGNVYVADSNNNEIRKISPAGVVTTLAGSTTPGSADGTGTDAGFAYPSGVAVDTAGTVYVADTNNNEIRKISAAGVVTTLAGSTTPGSADGTGASASFYLATRIAQSGVAVDSAGNVYVADTGNNEIRKISAAGMVTTLAGSTTPGSADGTGPAASFNEPTGVAVDSAGNVYVADSGNNEIRKISPAGVVSTLAGSKRPGAADGSGTAASFDDPEGVAVDGAGNVYVADTVNAEIRRISPVDVVTTVAGSPSYVSGSTDGIGSAASFNSPSGVAVDSAGNVYVADQDNNEIRKISPTGVVSTLAGSTTPGATNGSGSLASFNGPEGVAVDSAGNVYVADQGNNEIRKISATGVVTTFAGSTTSGSTDAVGLAARFNAPGGVAVDNAGDVYVADSGNNEIRKISPAGAVSTLAGSTTAGSANGTGSAARFNSPYGVAVDVGGNVYVADTNNSEIRKISHAGVVTTLAGSSTPGSANGTGAAAGFGQVTGIAVDSVGNVYVADDLNDAIREISPAGVVTTLAGTIPGPPPLAASTFSPGELPGQLGFVFGVAVSQPNSSGNWNMVISTGSAIAQITNADVYVQ